VADEKEFSDLILRQSCQPIGYHVSQVMRVYEATQVAILNNSDVWIIDLNLPGFYGKA
jgi:hypothetical protein